MNQKRKAELQRKLSMTSMPKPPAGLAARIKADIPHDLMNVERDRQRFSRSTAFSMRVAASILLLVTSVYLSLHLVSRSERAKIIEAHKTEPVPMAARNAAAPAAPAAEVTITLASTKKEMPADREAKSDQTAKGAERSRQEKDVAESGGSALVDKQAANEVRRTAVATGGIAGGVVADTAARPAAPAALPPPAEPASRDAVAERISVARATPDLDKTAQAAGRFFDPPRAVFGISVDPTEFDRVKHGIEQGERPAPGSIDVAALVNYFAGPPRPPRRDVRLDVEASRAPLAPESTALIRFTIDTPHEDIGARSSLSPVATNADLEIALNSDAVLSHHIIGAGELKTQATLMKNISVTGLLDLKLKPHVRPRAAVATLTLRYRSVADNRLRTITRTVYASELTRTWAAASRRHRVATLGAVWSESLNDGPAAADVARTAEKLATEAPDDARAQDLAALATASSRLQSSGPTGSGR